MQRQNFYHVTKTLCYLCVFILRKWGGGTLFTYLTFMGLETFVNPVHCWFSQVQVETLPCNKGSLNKIQKHCYVLCSKAHSKWSEVTWKLPCGLMSQFEILSGNCGDVQATEESNHHIGTLVLTKYIQVLDTSN